jgi:hypothetical protein
MEKGVGAKNLDTRHGERSSFPRLTRHHECEQRFLVLLRADPVLLDEAVRLGLRFYYCDPLDFGAVEAC